MNLLFSKYKRCLPQYVSRFIAIFMLLALTGPLSANIGFNIGSLSGYSGLNPTSLQFGPDGRLYVATQGGYLHVLTVSRAGPGEYTVVEEETITLVREIPNHNDDGSPHNVVSRQVTGILVSGTASEPMIYVTSSDYRSGGASGAAVTGLDTNSGVLSRLTRDPSSGAWNKVDLVRGLPRSEENHASNGLELDAVTNTLFIAQGGNTNAGSPSNNFAFLSEVALSAAILSVDLDAIDAMPVQGLETEHPWVYDLPTVGNSPNPDNPFGGQKGLNQARLVPGGPVQIYAPGFRNPYDLVITDAGRMYAVDNGANQGWGGTPHWTDPADPSTATNNYDPAEPGSTGDDANGERVTNIDYLHYITGPGYYAGHPNPVRANPAGAGLYTYDPATETGVWRTSTDPSAPFPLPPDWPPLPVESANPIEGDFQSANNPNALWGWPVSTNGIAEYAASNFSGEMTGDLLIVGFSTGYLYRVILSEDGTDALNATVIASNFGSLPLDVTTQGDDEAFPGTIWTAVYGSNTIITLEPTDYDGGSGIPCSGANDPWIDEDSDGFTNADEIANNSDPCNPADTPSDLDGDFISDLLDDDDDGDGLVDIVDPFQRDFHNGAREHLPINFEMFNNIPGYGFSGVGFTGWMIDNETDYIHLYDPDRLVVGGASGLFTVVDIDHGDARLSQNDQKQAFQFGLNIDAQSGLFHIITRLAASGLFEPQPQDYQSAGLYIGTGDQDNYLRISAAANGGSGGIEMYHEIDGVEIAYELITVPEVLTAASHIDLYLTIDPASGFVLPSYAIDNGQNHTLSPVQVGQPILGLLRRSPDSVWANTLAVGILATSDPRELGTPLEQTQFTASWDFIYGQHDDLPLVHDWTTLDTINECAPRHENGLAAINRELVLMGGRGIKPVNHLDLDSDTWFDGAAPPIPLHHFQAVVYDELVYVMGALTGNFPEEPPVDRIYIYDPVTATWSEGPMIPQSRRRGSAGAAVYNGKIYMVGGTTAGHGQGIETTVGWADAYDPITNSWEALPDAPHPRDHAQLVEVDGKLYLVGGRVGGTPGDFFSATTPEIDVFDPVTKSWTSLPPESNLPTPRGGVAAAKLGQRVVVAGGEGPQPEAHAEVEAYNTATQSWETLPPLIQERHATGMASVGNALYIVAGSGAKGGSPELSSVEMFSAEDDPVNPMSFSVPGTLQFSPSQLSFGSIPSGSSAFEPVALANVNGDQAIVINALSLNGSDFAIDDVFMVHRTSPNTSTEFDVSFPFILAPGHQVDIIVRFDASGSGAKSATLTATFRNGQSVSLPVSGTVDGEPPPEETIRINAGGPQYTDSLGQIWEADTFFIGGNSGSASGITINNTDEPALYQTERWGGSSMSYQIPVAAGSYDVHLHFAEIFWGVSVGAGQNQQGKRVFSVALEGAELLSDYDIWAEVGAATATIKSFHNISVQDGALSITVDPIVDNAKFSAIEVVPANGTPSSGFLVADPNALDFGSVVVGEEVTLPVTLSNSGSASLSITGSTLGGTDAEAFASTVTPGIELAPGASTTIDVTFAPSSIGEKSATLGLTHTGSNNPLTIPLDGIGEWDAEPPSGTIRINAGGPEYTDSVGQVWSADTHFVGGSVYFAGSIEIANTNDPVLYRTERYGDASFGYHIPLPQGDYTIRLHFAETFFGVHSGAGEDQTGKRVFSVFLEGDEVLIDYDIWADAGPATAVIKTFTDIGVHDGHLTIAVDPSANNAKFSALEIIPSETPPPGDLTATPASIQFGTVPVGQTATLATNLANSGGSSITITAAEVTGSGASYFNAPSLDGLELEPGASESIDIVFSPSSSGPKNAVLEITHTGNGSPLSIPLSGTGEAMDPPPSSGIRINAGGPQFTDSLGRIWTADAHFINGKTHNAGSLEIAGTDDPVLYRTERWGDAALQYEVPLESGTYNVHIHFAEIFWGVQVGVGQNNAGKRVFSVMMEGTTVLVDYDIWADVGSATAVIKSFEIDVSDGFLSIGVAPTADNAKFSAIEIIPVSGVLEAEPAALDFGTTTVGTTVSATTNLSNTGTASVTVNSASINGANHQEFTSDPLDGVEIPPGASIAVEVVFAPTSSGPKSASLAISHTGANSPSTIDLTGTADPAPEIEPIRINVGGGQYNDSLGQLWSADAHFTGGAAYSAGTIAIANTNDPTLYRSERWGNTTMGYDIPVNPGSYSVSLHFAEIYWGVTNGAGANHAGRRVFSVAIEGTPVLTDYDIWADVGPAAAVVHTFHDISVQDGSLTITVQPTADNAKFSAIEVLSDP